MRRKGQEIKDRKEIDAIIDHALVCRLAMCDGDRPYVVPMCFGYDGKCLYFHSAYDGMKLDFLAKNPRVCFEIEGVCEVEKADQACNWGMKYESVIGWGTASLVEGDESKRLALNIIVDHYAHGFYSYPDKAVSAIAVIRVDIDSLTGKHSS